MPDIEQKAKMLFKGKYLFIMKVPPPPVLCICFFHFHWFVSSFLESESDIVSCVSYFWINQVQIMLFPSLFLWPSSQPMEMLKFSLLRGSAAYWLRLWIWQSACLNLNPSFSTLLVWDLWASYFCGLVSSFVKIIQRTALQSCLRIKWTGVCKAIRIFLLHCRWYVNI